MCLHAIFYLFSINTDAIIEMFLLLGQILSWRWKNQKHGHVVLWLRCSIRSTEVLVYEDLFWCQVLYVTNLGHLVGEEWKIESRDYNNMLFKEQLLNNQSAYGCLSLSNVCSIFQLSCSSSKRFEDFCFRNFLVILFIYYYIYFHA